MKPSPENFIVAFRGEARRKGFSQVPNVVLLDKTISSEEYRLYSLLVSYAMQSGGSVASQGAMSADLGKCDRAIRNWLKTLEDKHLITIHRPGQMQPNIYIIEDAYELYDAQKPKKPEGRQPSPEPPCRSKQESRFRSGRNAHADQAGTPVPTLNKNSGNNKREEPEIIATLLSEQKEPGKMPFATYKSGSAKFLQAIDAAKKAGKPSGTA